MCCSLSSGWHSIAPMGNSDEVDTSDRGDDEKVGIQVRVSPVRLSQEVKAIMAGALERAREMNAQTVDTALLLLALLETGSGPGIEALVSLGVTADAVRGTVTETHEPAHQSKSDSPPLSSEFKEAVGRATFKAASREDPEVVDGHLLLGILEDPSNSGSQVLERLTPGIEDLRRVVLDRMTL